MPRIPFTRDNQPARREPPLPVVHLYRGAPAVRMWSMHTATIESWTLCGIKRNLKAKTGGPSPATEDASQVTCEYCLDLMQPKSYDRPHTTHTD
jgi:hypothetical protein